MERRADGPEPLRGLGGPQEIRYAARTSVLAVGTLACPACDAPVSPGPAGLAPSEAVACPYCGREGRVREFLTLGAPTRPARVRVRVTPPAARRAAPARATPPR